MRLAARNNLAGTVCAVQKGTTTAHVTLALSGGAIVTASITNEAVDALELKVGDQAAAIIKASDVMIDKE